MTSFPVWAFTAAAVWGVVQLVRGWSVYPQATRDGVLYWLMAAALVFVGGQLLREKEARQNFLTLLAGFAFVISVVGMMQFHSSQGKVFWIFSTPYENEVVGPFVSRNTFAAFIELILPFTLLEGLRKPKRRMLFMVMTAAMYAAVVGTASRAGTVLVTAEVVLVFLLAFGRGMVSLRSTLSAAGQALVVLAVFTAVAGPEYVWHRLFLSDPYTLRREFLQASINMAADRPWTGFGLGSWASVYPAYALVSVAAFVNHAHCEWAQWAGEGGIPLLAVMASVGLWCVLPALRSVWGIGVLSVLVHCVVDYPLYRVGLGAWAFVMIGALAARRAPQEGSEAERAGAPWKALAVAMAGLAVWAVWARTERTAEEWLEQARTLDTDGKEAEAKTALERAVAINPRDSRARIELALKEELQGHTQEAEKQLLTVGAMDRQYEAAWALANFYFRQNQPDKFWPWAVQAAQKSYGSGRELFRLCWRVSPEETPKRLGTMRPEVEAEYAAFLLVDDHAELLEPVLMRLVKDPKYKVLVAQACDGLLRAHRFDEARRVWEALEGQKLPDGIQDPQFVREPDGRGFGWKLANSRAISFAQLSGRGLRIGMTGKQPQVCEALSQYVKLEKGREYEFQYQGSVVGEQRASGLTWHIEDAESRESWGNSADFATSGGFRFRAGADYGRLVLEYRRTLGETRWEGTALLEKAEIK